MELSGSYLALEKSMWATNVNFEVAMLAWKWAPALAAGCTLVMKPAEQVEAMIEGLKYQLSNQNLGV